MTTLDPAYRPTILDRLSIVAGNLHELAKGDANQDLIAELEDLDCIVLDMATEMRRSHQTVSDPNAIERCPVRGWGTVGARCVRPALHDGTHEWEEPA